MVDKTQYQAYLIRFYRGAGQTHWRVTLQNAHSTEVIRFATERLVIDYLLNSLNVAPPRDEVNTDDSSSTPA